MKKNKTKNRVPLPDGYTIKTKSGYYTIIDCIGFGASGITYLAENDGVQGIIIKEIFPINYSQYITRNKDNKLVFTDDCDRKSEIKEELQSILKNEIINNNISRQENEISFYMDLLEVIDDDDQNEISLFARCTTSNGFVLEKIGNIGLIRIFKIIYSLLESVVEMHKQGVFHLDIKPSNCFITSFNDHEMVKLLDFGSSIRKEDREKLKKRTTISNGYSSNELMDLYDSILKYNYYVSIGDPDKINLYKEYVEYMIAVVNEHADYYSIGATLYYLLFHKRYLGIIETDKLEGILNKYDYNFSRVKVKIMKVLKTSLSSCPDNRYWISNNSEENVFLKDISEIISILNECDENKKNLGKPKYKTGDILNFYCDNDIEKAFVCVVDKYGTFEQNKEVSYDLKNGNYLYKHIRESNIINKIGNINSIKNYYLKLFNEEEIDNVRKALDYMFLKEKSLISKMLELNFKNGTMYWLIVKKNDTRPFGVICLKETNDSFIKQLENQIGLVSICVDHRINKKELNHIVTRVMFLAFGVYNLFDELIFVFEGINFDIDYKTLRKINFKMLDSLNYKKSDGVKIKQFAVSRRDWMNNDGKLDNLYS